MKRFSTALLAAASLALSAGCDDDDPAELEDASNPVEEDGSVDDEDAGGVGDEDAAVDDDAGALPDGGADDAGTDDAGGLDGMVGTGDAGLDDAGGLDGMIGTGDAGLDDAAAPDGSEGDAGGCGNAGLSLPEGFCAAVFADDLPGPRHMAITPAGDVFVASSSGAGSVSFVSLRDSDGDGLADVRESVGSVGGNGIDWAGGYLYFAPNNAVLRYPLPDGSLTPTGDAEVVVSGLPDTPDHYAKTVVYANNYLYVNIGSASNSCQVENRALESPGLDPCPELAVRAGIWKFRADVTNQSQAQGERITIGTRNANAMAFNGQVSTLYAALNGRDQLHENWPDLFTAEEDARLPAEKIVKVGLNNDYGWPYCYFDAQADHYRLAPEYGGDGDVVGDRCATLRRPIATLPAHWAPLGMTFYHADQFPARYQHGAFIANHGSRFAPGASEPLPGYNVVFIPFAEDGNPSGDFERFAEGFAGSARPLPDNAEHRPVDVKVHPDGSLLVSDDKGGVIFRIWHEGS